MSIPSSLKACVIDRVTGKEILVNRNELVGAHSVMSFTQEEPAQQWFIKHNRNNLNAMVDVFEETSDTLYKIECNSIVTAPNSITIDLGRVAKGRVILTFLQECEVSIG